jgi:malate dehydrogenase (oxaloacetate-decarboxylating)
MHLNSTPAVPSISHSFTLQLRYPNQIGMFARIARTVGELGGDLGAVDMILEPSSRLMTRSVSVCARNQDHVEEIVTAVGNLEKVKILKVVDRVFQLHQGGKISLQNKVPVTSREVLSLAYTPGVARVCTAIAQDPKSVWGLTLKGNSVAVVSDGSAVLGLGNIGPEAALPVMEGKAMLFKEFAGIDAYPICLGTQEPEAIVETVANLSVGFGGINLEDISAPRCFEIEEKLQRRLDIPVFHDDQHGTAIVVLAGVLNSLRLTGQQLAKLKVVISGAGAAGVAVTKILSNAGAANILVCDREGIIHKARPGGLNDSKLWLARHTNPGKARGGLADALKGAHIFIGVSGPGVVEAAMIRRMAPRPIVFALANPTPEIMPGEAKVFIMATGRSDYANQINNVLAFPGVFRGALNVRARQITEAMKLAAAHAIARCVAPRELNPEFIVPSVFNRQVVELVADAVQKVALKSGVARCGGINGFGSANGNGK